MDNQIISRNIVLPGGANLSIISLPNSLDSSQLANLYDTIEKILHDGVKGIIIDFNFTQILDNSAMNTLLDINEMVQNATGYLWLVQINQAILTMLESNKANQWLQTAENCEQAQCAFTALIAAHTASIASQSSLSKETTEPTSSTADIALSPMPSTPNMEESVVDAEAIDSLGICESIIEPPTATFPSILDNYENCQLAENEDNETKVERAIQRASETSALLIDIEHPFLIQLGSNMQVFKTYPLQTKITIGRNTNNFIQVLDPLASKRHLEIFPTSKGRGKSAKIIWLLHDFESTNGTYLNGKRISEETILNDRDLIQLGRTTFIFSWEAQSSLFAYKATVRPIQQLEIPKFYDTIVHNALANIESQVKTLRQLSLTHSFESKELHTMFDTIESESKELRKTLQWFAGFEQALDQEQDSDGMLKVFGNYLGKFLENKLHQWVFLKYECTDQEQRYLSWQKPEKTLQISKALLNQLRKKISNTAVLQCFILQNSNAQLHAFAFYCPNCGDLPFPFLFFYMETKEQSLIHTIEIQYIGTMLDIFINHLKHCEQARRKNEIESARYLQQKIIPQPHFSYNTLEYSLHGYGVYQSASELGGDYYDHKEVARYRYIFVGDVAGKGVDAAMVSTSIKAYLTAVLSTQVAVLPRIAVGLDKFLSSTFPAKQKSRLFTTMLLLRWNSTNNEIEWINAGHNAPLLCSLINDRWTIQELITENSSALGLPCNENKAKPNWETQKCILNPNEFLMLYSDGVTEAMNPQNIPFGMNGIQNSIQSLPIQLQSASFTENILEEIAKSILKKIDQYRNGRSQFDDLTMVLLQTKKTSGY